MLLILWLFERDDIFGRYRIETSYGSVIEASQGKLGATDRPDLRVGAIPGLYRLVVVTRGAPFI